VGAENGVLENFARAHCHVRIVNAKQLLHE